METYYPVIAKCPLFQEIEFAQFHVLFPCIQSHTKRFTQNEYIVLAGSELNFVGIVLTGALEIIKENPVSFL